MAHHDEVKPQNGHANGGNVCGSYPRTAGTSLSQLCRLIDISDGQRNVTLQVLPFAAGTHAATSGPFVIITFPGAPDLGLVYLQGQTGGIYLHSSDEVARYTLAFEHLRATALSTTATRGLIEEIVAAT